jgi:predicted anti-sigma-YlaC factor YlaD
MNRTDTLTCEQISKAQLFELAHLDRHGRLHHLAALDAEPIRQHLQSCPACKRWYQNGLRALDRPLPDLEATESDTFVQEADTVDQPSPFPPDD